MNTITRFFTCLWIACRVAVWHAKREYVIQQHIRKGGCPDGPIPF